MRPFSITTYPRAILHIDGDSFFAACEVAKNPRLRGRPVVTGKERGIVSAASYEAKALGISRAMSLHEVRKKFPEAVILPSDYETYSIFSRRMYEIVRRYTPALEEYSIDECFADLSGMRRVNKMGYEDMASHIKHTLQLELGITFSVGLSTSKVLAKIGSKWRKPDGLTFIPLRKAHAYLAKVPVENVWGIGPNTGLFLKKHMIQTALQFAMRPEQWVQENLSKPFYELWRELRGDSVLELVEKARVPLSISKTRTFTPPSKDASFVHAQLSKNVENACIKARRYNLAATRVFFFLKDQEFRYKGFEIKLSHASNVPSDILRALGEYFPQVLRRGAAYRATGVVLSDLEDAGRAQLDLFGSVLRTEGLQQVFGSVDTLRERYGKHAVFLASSFRAMKEPQFLGERGEQVDRIQELFPGETVRRRLKIPLLGEVM